MSVNKINLKYTKLKKEKEKLILHLGAN